MKKNLIKAPQRQQEFIQHTKLSLPPVPVITRWGTWLNTALFYVENYSKVSTFIDNLNEKDSIAIQKVQALNKTTDLENQLLSLKDYEFLPSAITKLEERSLKMSDQLEILNDIKTKLDGVSKEKLETSLRKNPDLKAFTENIGFEHRLKTLYAPLVSVEVERSFSLYKNILSDKRKNLTAENVERLNIIQYNSF